MVSLPTGIEGQQPCCEGYSLALVTRQPSREVGGGGGMAASLLGTLGLSHRPWLLDSRAWAQGSPGARPASSRSGNGSGSGKTSAEDTPSSPWQESGAVPGLSRSAPGATLGAGRGGAGPAQTAGFAAPGPGAGSAHGRVEAAGLDGAAALLPWPRTGSCAGSAGCRRSMRLKSKVRGHWALLARFPAETPNVVGEPEKPCYWPSPVPPLLPSHLPPPRASGGGWGRERAPHPPFHALWPHSPPPLLLSLPSFDGSALLGSLHLSPGAEEGSGCTKVCAKNWHSSQSEIEHPHFAEGGEVGSLSALVDGTKTTPVPAAQSLCPPVGTEVAPSERCCLFCLRDSIGPVTKPSEG